MKVDYNVYLQEIATLQNEITREEEKSNSRIIKIRTDLEDKIGQSKVQLDCLKKELTNLVLENKDADFTEKKSHDFPAGKISIKKSGSSTLIIANEEETIKILKRKHREFAIKVEESVKKNVVKDMDDLADLGCELKEPEEKVYIETFKTILTSTGAA